MKRGIKFFISLSTPVIFAIRDEAFVFRLLGADDSKRPVKVILF